MVNDLKTRNNISSNNKTSKNKNVSAIIKDCIIKEIKGWELLTLLQQWGIINDSLYQIWSGQAIFENFTAIFGMRGFDTVFDAIG